MPVDNPRYSTSRAPRPAPQVNSATASSRVLLSTSTGGTVWRSSSTANGTVGQLNISDRLPSIAVRDKEEAYGEIVRQLIVDVTRDLRPTWVKQ